MSETITTADTETAAARSARQRREAADRARDHRERQRAELAALRARVAELEAKAAELEAEAELGRVDALLVAGLARAVTRDRAAQPPGEVPVTGAAVTVRAILDQAAKAGRNAGGDYDACAAAAGERLKEMVAAVARPATAAA